MTPQEIAAADERTWEELHGRLVSWGALLLRSGVATLFGHIASEGLPARLLAEVDGERLLTDLGHIAELLHTEATQAQLGLAALRAWLARRIDEPTPEGAEAEQRSRRLDSGADAVQVLTVHRAKGLEFPIVYCPYLWDPATLDRIGGPVVFHDTDRGGPAQVGRRRRQGRPRLHEPLSGQQGRKTRRGPPPPVRRAHEGQEPDRHLVGRRDRMRAFCPRATTHRPGAGRGRGARGEGERRQRRQDRSRAEATGRASAGSHQRGALQRAGAWSSVAGGVPACRPGVLFAAPFDRHLDLGWRRSSYTSITAGAHASGHDDDGGAELVGSEPEDPGTSDEPVNPLGTQIGPGPAFAPGSLVRAEQDQEQRLRSASSLLSALPAGRDFGTFVHRVLEKVDFSTAELALRAVGRCSG